MRVFWQITCFFVLRSRLRARIQKVNQPYIGCFCRCSFGFVFVLLAFLVHPRGAPEEPEEAETCMKPCSCATVLIYLCFSVLLWISVSPHQVPCDPLGSPSRARGGSLQPFLQPSLDASLPPAVLMLPVVLSGLGGRFRQFCGVRRCIGARRNGGTRINDCGDPHCGDHRSCGAHVRHGQGAPNLLCHAAQGYSSNHRGHWNGVGFIVGAFKATLGAHLGHLGTIRALLMPIGSERARSQKTIEKHVVFDECWLVGPIDRRLPGYLGPP